MGISMLTAFIIKNNSLVKCDAGGPDTNGKYMGWIVLDEGRWHPLLNSEPIFDSKQSAINEMEKLVTKLKEVIKEVTKD